MALEERKRDYLVKNTVFTLAQVNHLVHLFNSVASEPGNDNQSSSTAGENGATNLNPKDKQKKGKQMKKGTGTGAGGGGNQSGEKEISRDELWRLTEIPECTVNPFIEAGGRLYCRDDGALDAFEFVKLLNMFARDIPAENKRRFMFRMLDVNHTDFIDYDDLFRFLKMLKGPAVPDHRLVELCQVVLARKDLKYPGRISYEDFCRFVSVQEAYLKLTVAIQFPNSPANS
ncbi:calcineurin subunit B-like [Convolutriloba macropyga]|uniref:calcineurin subunit B-like n=1 Tax=Convolutriloba macropyga TaxID=536237 RepID=UPI003F51FEC3